MRVFFALLCSLLLSFSIYSQAVTQTQTSESTSETPQNKANSSVDFLNIKRDTVVVPKFDSSPIIDGKVNDEIWKKAKILRDFIQTAPGDHILPSKQTEMLIAYDELHIYIAFKCWDEKDKIRGTLVGRDEAFGEDNVRVWFDTYDDQRRAYVLGFNPLGIQQDGIVTENQGTDFNLDIVMESKGVIEDWGWSVEAKIPFKSLRYTAGKGKFWGFNAARNIDRFNDELDSWVPLPRGVSGFLNKFGKLTGLDEIKTERTIEIIPTLTFKETGKRLSQTKFSNPPIEPDFGFTAKFQLSPSVTLDAAYNPDFADTEADAPIVEANQRFPIFFQEKRPFFLEGYDVFNTRIQAVYTRQVQNPDVALKLTGKTGKNSFGVFGAVDQPLSNNLNDRKAYVGVVRLKRDVGAESNIGFLATTYNFEKRNDTNLKRQKNNVYGFDGRWKINKKSSFSAQILRSTATNYFYNPLTDEEKYEKGNGISHSFNYSYDEKNKSWGFGGQGTSGKYRSDLGFTRQNNSMNNFVYGNLRSDPNPKGFIINKSVGTSFGVRNDYKGRLQGWGLDFNVNSDLKGNSEVGFGGYVGYEAIYEDEFGRMRSAFQTGAFAGDSMRSAQQGGGFVYFEKAFNKRISVNTSANINFNNFDYDLNPDDQLDPKKGTQISFDIGTELKPTDKLSMELSYSKSKLTQNKTKIVAFDANIYQFRSTYQFSRFVFVKARLDYNTLSSRLFGQYTFGWTPSPGKAFYVGYNDNWRKVSYTSGGQRELTQQNRTLFVKFSYLFRKSF
jgi:Carbohydrate family 9 binding domain-like